MMMDAVPEICSCAALRQAARHVTRLYDEALAPCGLGLNQYSILAKLDRFGPKSIQDLAALLVMDRSTVGHLLRPLQARDLVCVETAAADRRERVVSLAADGAALVARAKPYWAKAETQFEQAYGVATARDLRVMLKQAASLGFAGT